MVPFDPDCVRATSLSWRQREIWAIESSGHPPVSRSSWRRSWRSSPHKETLRGDTGEERVLATDRGVRHLGNVERTERGGCRKGPSQGDRAIIQGG